MIKLTPFEFELMNWVAYNEMGPLNGDRPECHTDAGSYMWFDEIGASLGISRSSAQSVYTSLIRKKAVTSYIIDGDDHSIDFTKAGYAAWDAAEKQQKGS